MQLIRYNIGKPQKLCKCLPNRMAMNPSYKNPQVASFSFQRHFFGKWCSSARPYVYFPTLPPVKRTIHRILFLKYILVT